MIFLLSYKTAFGEDKYARKSEEWFIVKKISPSSRELYTSVGKVK